MDYSASTKMYYEKKADEYFKLTRYLDVKDLWETVENYLPKGSVILDLGSGSGRDLYHFHLMGYKVMGLDFSYKLSKLAHASTGQTIIVGDMRKPPFKSGVFDLILSVGSLLHIPRSQIQTTLRNIRNLLKSEGLLLTSIKKGKGSEIDKEGRYFASYEEINWLNILKNNGFTIELTYISRGERVAYPKDIKYEIDWIVSLAKKEE